MLPADTVEFQASGLDGEGHPISHLTFAWSIVNGGGHILASGPTTLSVQAVAADATYANTVVATTSGVSGMASIVISNTAPLASFSCGACTSPEGQPLPFDASASSDPNLDPLIYTWTFGDGSTGSGQSPAHPYPDNGTYAVTLTVEDDDGLTDTYQSLVTITNAPPAPTIAAPHTAQPNEPVTFTANANDPGDDTFEYQWDWGDGTAPGIATTAVTSHTFTAEDTYTVTLRVTDDDAGSGQTTHVINVRISYSTYLPTVTRLY
jgi:PKD repeat protein